MDPINEQVVPDRSPEQEAADLIGKSGLTASALEALDRLLQEEPDKASAHRFAVTVRNRLAEKQTRVEARREAGQPEQVYQTPPDKD